MIDSTYVKIDLDAIEENFSAVCRRAGNGVMAVIKADAYGHGAIEVARLLENKARFFGVSSILEAQELRQAGVQTPILILGYTPVDAYPIAIELEVRPAIFHYEDAVALSEAAVKLGKTAPFHFAVDTGMSRIGFQTTVESADLCAEIVKLPGLCAEGLFSHFATADCEDLTRAKAQAERFAWFDAMLKDRGVNIPLRHLNNSAGIINFGGSYEMVRAGIVIYGLLPSDEVDPSLLELTPAMSWHSRLTHVKLLPPGRQISYGGTFETDREMPVGTVPVGYADGYRRSLSGRFHVLVGGKKCPILGRVCMDQLMIDLSAVPDAKVGDPVVLMGKQGQEQITAEEIAEAAGSFNYEFVCGVSRRVPKVYIRNGEIIHTVHYLTDK